MKTPWLVPASARFRSASRSSKRRNRDAASATINPIAIVVPPAVIAIERRAPPNDWYARTAKMPIKSGTNMTVGRSQRMWEPTSEGPVATLGRP